MKRTAFGFVVVFFLLGIPFFSAEAAKPRVRKPAVAKKAAGVSLSYVTVKKSKPSHSLKILFSNLGNVSKVTYEVQYTATNGSQGIVGSFTPSGQTTDARDVYLGTCSGGVCTPHGNPRSIVVVARVTLKNGGTYTKVSRASTF